MGVWAASERAANCPTATLAPSVVSADACSGSMVEKGFARLRRVQHGDRVLLACEEGVVAGTDRMPPFLRGRTDLGAMAISWRRGDFP